MVEPRRRGITGRNKLARGGSKTYSAKGTSNKFPSPNKCLLSSSEPNKGKSAKTTKESCENQQAGRNSETSKKIKREEPESQGLGPAESRIGVRSTIRPGENARNKKRF